MKIPLTKYGWPQVAIFPISILVLLIIFIALGAINMIPFELVVFLIFVFVNILIFSLAFFRDPHRNCPDDTNLLLSPADGKITEIETIQESDFINGPTLKIGIFLSIFNVHINRAPCNIKVEKITYKQGKYKNALYPESSRVNESNELQMVRTDEPMDKLKVKQISGAIARRIVCKTSHGEKLGAGDKFGMIKFGSRTELFVSIAKNESDNEIHSCDSNMKKMHISDSHVQDNQYKIKCLVQIGDKVKAGLTPLVRYEKCQK